MTIYTAKGGAMLNFYSVLQELNNVQRIYGKCSELERQIASLQKK